MTQPRAEAAPKIEPLAQGIAVYVHTPFCPSKCGYCDFNSYAMSGPIMERTVRAIVAEIEGSPWAGIPARTIFFGGGTPTYLTTDLLLDLLAAVIRIHPPTEKCEITSEANPGTVDASKFAAMRAAGFNRLSLGAQSFFDDDLLRLDRVHTSGDIERAVDLARKAGFENLNLDLMFALPGQTLKAWERNLQRAMGLEPDHLSLYCLTLEPNTRFYKEHLRGALVLPDDECQVAMYDLAHHYASAAGFEAYEISNFARPGKRCEHNLCYWRHQPYAGYGPGAVGCMDGRNVSLQEELGLVRYTNLKHPDRYCSAVETGEPIAFEHERLTSAERRSERIMLGLRLTSGLSLREVELDSKAVDRLRERGWIDLVEDSIRLTPAGRHFCSEVALELI
jgi:oxygen-independent coproporphyrinogen-3 oxidase